MLEYTKLEELQGTFSDLYKDVNGIRPRWCTHEQWNSEEFLEEQLKKLFVELEEVVKAEKEAEEIAIAKFEAKVTEIINCGAGDRQTALRWIFDAEEDPYIKDDLDYFCYEHGLPYGYFKRS